ncbi:MAG: hypothetical protein M1301_00255 [Candidatus Thermoplasmatota archaeon]|jgi:hypothetical protein|nr:hypothetical protein [Candidatus Thermoplasmatota archaeon]
MVKPKAEPIFEEPEFDERQYLEGEKERAKTMIVTFVIGAFLGLFAGYIYVLGYGYLDILLIFVFIIFIKQILKGLGLTLPKRTWHWVLVGGEFLLTVIIFWTIFINPPITTVSSIQISGLQYENLSSGSWISPAVTSNINILGIPGSYHMRVYVNYNSPISNVSVTAASVSSAPLSVGYQHYDSITHYEYFNLSPISSATIYTVTITAIADNNVSSSANFMIEAGSS